MTPKNKAKDLYRDFYLKTMFSRNIGKIRVKIAVNSALLCVDEIQDHAQMIEGDYEGYSSTWAYFNEVRNELKKTLLK